VSVSGWLLPIVAVLLIGYGAVSARLQTSVVSEAMVFVVAGLVIGSGALHLVDLGPASAVVLLLAEATLAVVLFTDAVRVRLPRLRHEAAVPLRLLGIGLPLTIVAGTVVGLLVFPDLNVWTAAALATILAPTDAALGLPVISNQNLPSRIRQGLNVESGLNDGVCVPLLIIFLTLAAAEEDMAQTGPVRILLEEIGFGALGGVAAGVLGAWVLRQAVARRWATPGWQQIISVATAILAYTVAVALGGSGFIASFVAGITFAVVAGAGAESSTGFAEQSGQLLDALTFLMFGAVLLGPALGALDWSVVLYALLSLTVVRMVPVGLAMLGMRMRPSTVAFLGWFGPRGLASIVFVLVVVDEGSLAESALLQTVVSVTVGLSVFAHGLSAYPLARAYATWFADQSTDHPAMSENRMVRAPRHRAERVRAGGAEGSS
jgi:NhaP-type Na+/H+ or K+/H+ antiporter